VIRPSRPASSESFGFRLSQGRRAGYRANQLAAEVSEGVVGTALAHAESGALAVELRLRDVARVLGTFIERARAGWAQETSNYDLCPIDGRAPRA
jgi:hypothetical protein